MLSWGGRGKRKWEGPGVNHSGREAWRQGPALCLTLPCDGVLIPRHRGLAWASGCLCAQEMGSRPEAQTQGSL